MYFISLQQSFRSVFKVFTVFTLLEESGPTCIPLIKVMNASTGSFLAIIISNVSLLGAMIAFT